MSDCLRLLAYHLSRLQSDFKCNHLETIFTFFMHNSHCFVNGTDDCRCGTCSGRGWFLHLEAYTGTCRAPGKEQRAKSRTRARKNSNTRSKIARGGRNASGWLSQVNGNRTGDTRAKGGLENSPRSRIRARHYHLVTEV